jgi:hypothetical protein
MIAALSMLWPLMALASDREEEGETPSLRRIIATWLALGDYDSIVKTLGVCPLEPLMEDLDRQIEAHLASGENNSILHILWRTDLDPSWQFVSSYIRETTGTRTPGPHWLTDEWCKDYPDIQGLIDVYNQTVREKKNLYRTILKKRAEIKVEDPFVHITYIDTIFLPRCGGMIPRKIDIQSPGWEDGWPRLNLDPNSTWFAVIKRNLPKKMQICRCIEAGLIRGVDGVIRVGTMPVADLEGPDLLDVASVDAEEVEDVLRLRAPRQYGPTVKRWDVVFKDTPLSLMYPDPSGLMFPPEDNESLRNYCRKQGLFLLLLNQADESQVGHGLRITEKQQVLMDIAPLLGKMSDVDLSRRYIPSFSTIKITADQIRRMRRDNGIPTFRSRT